MENEGRTCLGPRRIRQKRCSPVDLQIALLTLLSEATEERLPMLDIERR